MNLGVKIWCPNYGCGTQAGEEHANYKRYVKTTQRETARFLGKHIQKE